MVVFSWKGFVYMYYMQTNHRDLRPQDVTLPLYQKRKDYINTRIYLLDGFPVTVSRSLHCGCDFFTFRGFILEN